MASHTEQTPQKENATVFIIVVLMFIIIAPVLGAIGKSSNSKNYDKSSGKGHAEQHDDHHGKAESHEEHHVGH